MASIEVYISVSIITILSLIILSFLFLFTAFLYHRGQNQKGADSANWISLLLYLLSSLDLLTDLFFFGQLCLQNDDLTIYAACFLFIPHTLSLILCVVSLCRWRQHCGGTRVPLHHQWLLRFDALLFALSALSTFYGAIELSNSVVFHLDAFNMQIAHRDRSAIHLVHVVVDVVLGAFPTMIVQMAFMSLNEYRGIALSALSMMFSFITIAIGIFLAVSRACNTLIEVLVPSQSDDDDRHDIDDQIDHDIDDRNGNRNGSNRNSQSTTTLHRLMLCESPELSRRTLFAHKLVARAWSAVLQIAEYQVTTTFITRSDLNGNHMENAMNSFSAITFKLKIKGDLNDENLFLMLNLLESPDSGLFDMLQTEVSNALALRNVDALKLWVHRTDEFSIHPLLDRDVGDDHGVDLDSENERQRIINHPVHGPTESTWECPVCTFKNHHLITHCEVCQSEKPKISEIGRGTVDAIKMEIENESISLNHTVSISEDDQNGMENGNENGMKHQLLKDIESENQQIQPQDGGLWTGDIPVEQLDDEAISIKVNVHSKDNGNNNDNDNDIESVFEDDDDAKDLEVVRTADGSNATKGGRTRGSDKERDGDDGDVEISEIEDKDDDREVIGRGMAEDNDSKEEAMQLFDNRYTDDGLNHDFDALRDRDPFQ